MIHAYVVESIPAENRGAITRALMGSEPTPAVPTAMRGARMPPIGVRVRELPKGNLSATLQQLRGVIPGMGGS